MTPPDLVERYVRFKELLDEWKQNASGTRTVTEYSVRLPIDDAARLHALTELFPGRTTEQLITDLLGAALHEVATAMPASMFVMVWAFVGFYTVLFVAAIKGVPAEIYEAARLDGAGRLRTIWSVTLPLIRDNVQTAWIYLGIAALDAFVWMQALNPFGGPNNSTLVMPQELFNTAFAKGQFGYATAMGVVLALITLLFAACVFLVNRLTGGRDEGGRL